MKTVVTFLVGFAAGILALLGFQYFKALDLSHHATPGNFDIRFATERISEAVDYEMPLFLTDRSGAEFRLKFEPASGGRVNYEWEATSDPMRRGSGTVFEKFEVVGKTRDGVRVKDVGSELRVEIEDLEIEWSSGGPSTKGWIYFHPDDVSVSDRPGANKTE